MKRRRGDKFVAISGEPAGVPLTIFALCIISRQVTQLNFTVFLSLFAFMIQYFRLTFAAVVATPGCPWLCTLCVINRDVLFLCSHWEAVPGVFLRMIQWLCRFFLQP